MTEFAPVSSFNRKALFGFILAIFAILAICIGILPVPFTALICYPPGFVMGIASLVYGVIALRELRSDGKNGHPLAWFAALAGGLTVLAMLCLVISGVLIYPYVLNAAQQLLHRVAP